MMLKSAFQSDVGRVRTVNEDRAVVKHDLGGLALAVVADGMGGHQAGDIASAMAVEHIQLELKHVSKRTPLEERSALLRAAVEAANYHIYSLASRQDQYHGMGTTIVAVLADEESAVIAHIGDSRAYLLRDGEIEQLTEDHSLVNELLKSGQITREEAESHPRRNVLTRALGTEPSIQVDVRSIAWQTGDVLLLCSDGLSGYVDAKRLASLALGSGELAERAKCLVKEALESGSDDNVTVMLLSNEPANLNNHDEEAG